MNNDSVFQKIVTLLDKEKIQYRLTEHQEVRTSEEAARVRGVDLGTGAKAMVVKAKETFYLLVLPGNKRIDWKKAKQVLNVKDIRFATEEEAESITHVKMGAVPPLGNILELPTYFDKRIAEIDEVNFNPGSKVHSIAMRSSDLIRIVSPQIADLVQE